MANSAFSKTSISLDSPVFTTKITSPIVVGGAGLTDILSLLGTSNVIPGGGVVSLQPSGGNVGIGTTTPLAKLDIVTPNDGSNILRLANGASTLGYVFKRMMADGALSIQGEQAGYNNILLAPTGGNVGIGTTLPKATLHSVCVAQVSAPTLGSGNGAGLIVSSGNNNLYGIAMGTMPTGGGWIQGQRFDGGATPYDITLQPSGADVIIGRNIYIISNCSALSFTDRTPHYDGHACKEIKLISGKDGLIDHSTLPKFARVKKPAMVDGKEVEQDERDLGAMISIHTKALQELIDRIELLENQKDEVLENKV
jgi:hypothetical protein